MIMRDYQRAAVAAAREKTAADGNTLLSLPVGCHEPVTPVLMFNGTVRPFEWVSVGDRLTEQARRAA